MDIVVRADQPVEVTGQGTDPKVLVAGQSFTFTGVENLAVKAAEPDQIAPPPVTDDVRSPLNRPNGPTMTAIIAPKLPKSGGETAQEPVGPGSVREVPVAELGRATQGGGPEAGDDFKTPGPQPDQGDAGAAASPQLGAATGDVGPKGEPRERTEAQVSGNRKQQGGQKQQQGDQKSGGRGGAQKPGGKKGR